MVGTIDSVKIILVMMLFYSMAITMISYSIPAEAKQYVTMYSDVSDDINIEDTSQEVQASLTQQVDIPIIDLGALVFYSGNILLDLLLNFAFALPQMVGLIVAGFVAIFQLDAYLVSVVQLFASGTLLIIYVIGIIQLIVGVRAGTTRLA